MKIGVIGLDQMGYGMAAGLLARGHALTDLAALARGYGDKDWVSFGNRRARQVRAPGTDA